MSKELWRRGGTELAAMVADGAISAREVIDAHLDRIDEVNGWLNAVVRVDAEGARAAADTVIEHGRPAKHPGRWPACRSPSRMA